MINCLLLIDFDSKAGIFQPTYFPEKQNKVRETTTSGREAMLERDLEARFKTFYSKASALQTFAYNELFNILVGKSDPPSFCCYCKEVEKQREG